MQVVAENAAAPVPPPLTPVTVASDGTFYDAVGAMAESNCHRVYVTDGASKRLQGVVTLTDVLRVINEACA